MSEEFWKHGHDWLLEKFPNLAEEGTLVDGKSVDKWLDYITVETKNRWRGSANRTWKTLLGQPFYRAEIKVTLDMAMDTTTDDGMELDTCEAPSPIDLKDLTIFQNYNCPRCDFKTSDRILFKTHVVKSHEYIKGEFDSISRKNNDLLVFAIKSSLVTGRTAEIRGALNLTNFFSFFERDITHF